MSTCSSSRASARRPTARKLGATVIAHEPALQVIEEAAAWSGGVLQPADGLPMAYPGAIDVVYDTVGKRETFESAREWRARHDREGRRARTDVLGGHAALLQGAVVRRLERVRFEEIDGVRRTASSTISTWRARRRRPHRIAHAHVPPRRVARRVHGPRHPRPQQRDQSRLRLPLVPSFWRHLIRNTGLADARTG